MKKIIVILLIGMVIIANLNAEVLICKGVKSMLRENGKLVAYKAEHMKMQLNITSEKAVIVLENGSLIFDNYVGKIEHPSGLMMDTYNDNENMQIMYSKTQKIAGYISYLDGTEDVIITYQCKHKKY